jgi:hypothetical protein
MSAINKKVNSTRNDAFLGGRRQLISHIKIAPSINVKVLCKSELQSLACWLSWVIKSLSGNYITDASCISRWEWGRALQLILCMATYHAGESFVAIKGFCSSNKWELVDACLLYRQAREREREWVKLWLVAWEIKKQFWDWNFIFWACPCVFCSWNYISD